MAGALKAASTLEEDVEDDEVEPQMIRQPSEVAREEPSEPLGGIWPWQASECHLSVGRGWPEADESPLMTLNRPMDEQN